MKIRFVTPPAAKQIGGIENAVEGLRQALQQRDISVEQGGDPSDALAIHHFHGLWDRSHSRLASELRKLGRPYIVSPHGMLEPWALHHRRWKKVPYFHLIERRYLVGAASLFVTSGMEEEHLGRVLYHPRVEVLPLGCRDRRSPDYLSARKSVGWSGAERIMLFLSRIDPKKGLDNLLRALQISDCDWTSWRFVVVGDGSPAYVALLKSMANGVAEKLPIIEWVGPMWGEARWSYLQGADLFCLPLILKTSESLF